MATGENVLWVVEKTNKYSGRVTQRFVFRTRSAAIRFKARKQNAEKNPRIEWYRKRATWGPEE